MRFGRLRELRNFLTMQTPSRRGWSAARQTDPRSGFLAGRAGDRGASGCHRARGAEEYFAGAKRALTLLVGGNDLHVMIFGVCGDEGKEPCTLLDNGSLFGFRP